MAFQISGISNVVAEVEAGTRALRVVQRPDDWGSLGIYSISQVSGTMAAGLAGGSNIYVFRNSTANPYLIRQVLFGAGGIVAFTAGVGQFNLFMARSFTANSAGGTAATLTTNNAKRRTAMATTGVAESRIASTAALTAGTWVLDAQPTSAAVLPLPATAGHPIVPPFFLWDCRDTEHPLVLDQNEGFTIQATVPATGTWQFNVCVEWLELASY